jgi:hypothetical protein
MNNARSQPFRLVVLTAALVAILFVATGAALWHYDAPGSAATCPLCYAAHLPILHSASAGMAPSSSAVAWMVACELRSAPPAPDALQFPPRGPPASPSLES